MCSPSVCHISGGVFCPLPRHYSISNMHKYILLPLAAALLAQPAMAGKKKDEKTPAVAEKKAPVRPGLFGVSHEKDDWFVVVPDSLLGRPLLVTTRYVATPAGAGVYGGELANRQVMTWERKGDKLLLRAQMHETSADSTQAIWRAVEASSENPIIAALKIENRGSDGRHYTVKATELFKGDTPGLSLSTDSKTRFGLGNFKPELSYVDTLRTFPINTEVTTVKTFLSKPGNSLPAGAETGVVTLKLNTSFVLLPRVPMRSRTFDPRVGYFTESFVEYADHQQRVKPRQVIARWRLEPRAEDMDKYRRGELVEPKKPIVYYIDPATPKQWRKYLILGVEDWQKAFEKAGFKNAIQAREWPENDSTMSLEDARFSVIRYLASPIPNAYGPNVHDPRSGEIIESHIGWYHNVMELLHDWYQTQVGPLDPRARKPEFDEELMGQLIRFVSSHEVGHTLGLRHNMGASSATPVEKLRDKAWVEQHGHTSSIMDYARFNYVAQPEDHIGEAGIFPRVNDYDEWAIRWGYTYYPDAKNEREERDTLNRLTVATITNNPRLWFGGEGRDNNPYALTEDLSDDVMKASDYGLLNLRRVVKSLPEWTYESGNLGDNLVRGYEAAVSQYRRYVGHVCRQIGGVKSVVKSVEQAGDVYSFDTRERQQRALSWLDRNVLTEPTWLTSPSYGARIGMPQLRVRPTVASAVDYLTSSTMFDRLAANAAQQPAARAYSPTTYADDLARTLFRETQSGARLSAWRMYVQLRAVNNLIAAYKSDASGDGHAYVTALLTKLRTRLDASRSADAGTRAHYADLSRRIRLALEGK